MKVVNTKHNNTKHNNTKHNNTKHNNTKQSVIFSQQKNKYIIILALMLVTMPAVHMQAPSYQSPGIR